MIASETRETQSLRPGFLAAFLCVLTLAALSGTEAGAVGRGALESAVAQYLRVEQLPLANPTDGQVLGYDSATKRAVWQDSSATIGGSLGSTDNVLLRSDGTGGVTAQGSTGTVLDDSGNLGVKSYSGSIAAISTVTLLDPDDGAVQSITLTQTMSGDATFSVDTTNLSASYARTWEVVVTATGGPWTLQFDADWTWISAKPTTIASGGKAVLYLRSYGAAETDVVACWVVRDSG